MGMNWLISLENLEIYKWGDLSNALVFQDPSKYLPGESYVLSNRRKDNIETMNLLTGKYAVYTAANFLRPQEVKKTSPLKVVTNHAEPTNTRRILSGGFFNPEDWGTWSNDTVSTFGFSVAKPYPKNLKMTLTVSPYLPSVRKEFLAKVKIGDEIISERIFDTEKIESWEMILPTTEIDENGILKLDLEIDRSLTDAEIAKLFDKRRMALLIRSIDVEFGEE